MASAPVDNKQHEAGASKKQRRAARFVRALAQSLTVQDTATALNREALAAALAAAVGRLPQGPSRASLEVRP
jgi:hypothetical protein